MLLKVLLLSCHYMHEGFCTSSCSLRCQWEAVSFMSIPRPSIGCVSRVGDSCLMPSQNTVAFVRNQHPACKWNLIAPELSPPSLVNQLLTAALLSCSQLPTSSALGACFRLCTHSTAVDMDAGQMRHWTVRIWDTEWLTSISMLSVQVAPGWLPTTVCIRHTAGVLPGSTAEVKPGRRVCKAQLCRWPGELLFCSF